MNYLESWFNSNILEITVSVIIIILYLVVMKFSKPRLEDGEDQGGFKEGAASDAINLIRLVFICIGGITLVLIWGVDLSSVVIFTTTSLTFFGVALFASWSLLSNVTAYFVLLVHPSFRRGTFVRVLDLDNYTEGYISELSMFNTKLITEQREVIIYPNVLLLGRPTLINPRDRLSGMGKIDEITVSNRKNETKDNK